MNPLPFVPRLPFLWWPRFLVALLLIGWGAGFTPASQTPPSQQTLDFLPPSAQAEAERQRAQFPSQDFDAWLELSRTSARARPDDWDKRQRLREQASAAAINAYAQAGSTAQAASALAALAQALELRSDWKTAIRAWRASLALDEQANYQAHLEKIIAEHGFRLIGHEVSSDAQNPRICLQFSDVLARDDQPLADYVELDRAGLAIESEARALCIAGVRHGERYHIRVRTGLPAHDGEQLTKTVELDVYVRDRRPVVSFPARAYVLPSGAGASLPILSVNTDVIQAQLYRISDRALGGFAADDELFERLTAGRAQALAERSGERLWQGEYEVRNVLNQDIRSILPLGAWLDDNPARPGLYVLTARSRERLEDDYQLATQWFLISDLGLTTLSGADGLHVLVRSLATAEPLAGVRLRLLALNQQVLGEAHTDERGHALFDPGVLRGTGGNRAALLSAENDAGDYGLLDLAASPFDLTDRGVAGRTAPGPIDVFLTTERGVYRPGERVALTALARDAQARAIPDLPLTYVIERPDGVEFLRQTVLDQGQGAHGLTLSLLPEAMRGTWTAAVHLDPEQPALARVRFLVEDFLPERLEFDLSTDAQQIDPRHPPLLELDARYLFGAPGAQLPVEGQTRLVATRALADYPGYRFGLADETFTPQLELLDSTQTDAQGHARLLLTLPDGVAPTQVLEAETSVRVIDSGGRAVERKLRRAVADPRARLGLRPLFEGAVSEGGNAAFELIALDAAGQAQSAEALTWTLSRVQTSFQWYQSDGQWRYEPVRERRRVASGALELDATNPARLEPSVDWGAYELEVRGAGLVPVSVDFNAGWFVSPKTQDSPDVLNLVLDRPTYRIGDTARVHLEPRFPGVALVMVINQGLVSMHPVEVPAEGADVELPVTADWGTGAYVTAALYRPLDVAARRLPQRAIGLQWGAVDPGARRLHVELEAPEQVAPRGSLPITVAITPLPEGQSAYLNLAVVDEGILNFTDFPTPAPDDWAFGQRQLGLDIRDLYGRLIDPLRGEPARLRSGGDAMALMQVAGPAPSEALLAYHSGIQAADAQGRAQFDIELPDFNGRARLMAMAWTAEGLGHGAADVRIRDPIVLSASLPRFLAPGDETRLLVEATHVEGPAGSVRLSLSSQGETLALSSPTTMEFTLNPEGRVQKEFHLTALAPGKAQLQLVLDTPDGQRLTKSLRLSVQDLTPPVQFSEQRMLRPGGPGLELGAGLLTRSTQEALEPGSETWRVAITGAGALDVAGLLRALERYPHGCAEQLTSRTLPLLYFDRLASVLGVQPDPQLNARIQQTIRELIGKQSADGGFGLWSAHTQADATQALWLDAYVSDLLTRAAEQGYPVPKAAFALALDHLKNQLNYSADFTSGGEGIAYALYVLTRNGRLSLGDLRYYFATKLEAFATPMARAQLGAALAMRGERERARQALESAAQLWRATASEDSSWRADFGSRLRDGAALVALSAEHLPAALPLTELSTELNDLAFARAQQGGWSRGLSTQEQAWLVLAARARMRGAAAPELEINGVTHSGPWNGDFDAVDLATAPMTVRNRGVQPHIALLTVSGQPRTPPPAGGQGYRMHRAYFDLAGAPVALDHVAQGQRLVAVLTISADQRRAARLLIEDPLPAGFEIDNPHLLGAGDLRGLAALNTGPDPLVNPAHQAFLADRLLAAVTREADDPDSFRLAYAVRAVSPGQFAHPQARLEAMYQPWLRAWTDAGRVTVLDVRSERD